MIEAVPSFNARQLTQLSLSLAVAAAITACGGQAGTHAVIGPQSERVSGPTATNTTAATAHSPQPEPAKTTTATPLLAPNQVKAAEAAGAAIVADCMAQYAGTQSLTHGHFKAMAKDTLVLQAAYKIDPYTLYPNYGTPGAKPVSMAGVVRHTAFAGCPDGPEQVQLKADLGVQ